VLQRQPPAPIVVGGKKYVFRENDVIHHERVLMDIEDPPRKDPE